MAKAFLMRDHLRISYNISPVEMVSKAIGILSPIGWISQATIVIDQALNDYEVVWAAAGHPHSVFPTTYSELVACTGAKPMVVGE
jgi:prolyl-tRNA editing enzyme YbaK/EbsC (Cys-tRNA(Pro) deacylase)